MEKIVKIKENNLELQKNIKEIISGMLDKMIDLGGVRIYIEIDGREGKGPAGYYPPFGLEGKYEPIISDSKERNIVRYAEGTEDNTFDFGITHSTTYSPNKMMDNIYNEHIIWPKGKQSEKRNIDSSELKQKFKKFFEAECKQKFPENEFIKSYQEDMEFNSKFDLLLDSITIRMVATLEKYPIVKVELG